MSAPLAGIRVLDLSWVMVGPFSARYLADLGADVVKVESSSRIDPLRTLGPFKDGIPGPERSVSYHNLNAGKRSITLDLKSEAGRAVALKLTAWADIVLESFTPRVLRSMRLAYDDLRTVRPDLIMVSTSIAGQTGPYASDLMGVGTMGAALSGATFLIGWPDRPPVGPFGPWTDEVTPRFIVSSLLAALHRRRRTGEGCYIDIAQAEAGMQFISPAAWEFTANGVIPQRQGSGSRLRCPFGSYPGADTDGWVVIDASGPAHWERLRALVGGGLLDSRYETLLGRLRHRQPLDAEVSCWTSQRSAQDNEHILQAAGVPAHAAVRAAALATDPDLRAAGHLQPIDDPVIGHAEIEGPRFAIAPSSLHLVRRGPLIGEHTYEVLRECAGLTDEDIASLGEAGAIA